MSRNCMDFDKTVPRVKIIMYATTDNGHGFASKVGEYDDIEEIELRIGMFASDVLISFVLEQ